MLKHALAVVAALCLTACSTLPNITGATGSTANTALHDFLTDPACSHHDEATFVSGAGGIPASFQAKVVRDCAVKAAP